MTDALARTYARFVAGLDYPQLPAAAVDKLKASLLHAAFVSLVGAQTAHGRAAIELVKEEEANSNGATVLADGAKATRSGAAFANSKLMHATNQTDSYRMLIHPGPCIIPAALATAELSGASGAELLTAMAAGYEVEARIAGDFIPATQARGFRCSPVYGTLGAAVTTAKLLGLDEDQTVTALGIAGSMASGLIHNFGTMTKPLHAGLTGRDGVTAVQLAQAGLTSGDQVVEHPFGFANTVLGPGIYDLDDMANNLGQPFRTQDALIIKKYPCCGGNHAMLDSLFSLMRDNGFTVDDVANAEIDQSYFSVVMLYQEPDDDLKGKFSAKYNVAAALVDGEVKIDTFTQEKIDDPTMGEVMDKVRTRVMAKSEELLTNSEDGLKVKITLKDGRVLEHTTSRAGILGSQGNPWGFDNIKAKFEENVALVLNDDDVNRAVQSWADIPEVTNVAELVRSTLVATKG